MSERKATNTLNLQGMWWLPEHPEHKVFGTFTWNVTDGGTLQLNGELKPIVIEDNVLPDGSVQKYRPRGPHEAAEYPVVWGVVDGTAYTLLDSFRLSVRSIALDDSIERVSVNRLLVGALFDYPAELDGDRLVIDLRHLTGWINPDALSTSHPRHDDGDDDRFSVITARRLPTLKVQDGRASVRFFQSLQEAGDRIHSLGVRQWWSLSVVYEEPHPLALLMETAGAVQDLVTIAVGETANFDEVNLQHPDLPKLSVGGQPILNWRENVTYYARWTNRAEPAEPVKPHDMYFTLDDFGGIQAVGRWLEVERKYRTELSRVMATRYSPHMFLEDRIMNISAALDSFDKVRRDTGKDVHYVDRIRACIELAGEPFTRLIVEYSDSWAEKVRAVRNDLAHHRDEFRVMGSVGDHLHSEQLFWLFTMCMLRLADAPIEVFDSISNHRQVRWLTEQATK